ncbi:MAG: hypothetical protein KA319_10795 [Ferruginibacter sp.]|nr:hypothetical protein [Ferruginibacter sp.]
MKTITKAKKEKIQIENKSIKKKSLAHLFGKNKNEVDGLTFQKKVRNEWN